MLMYFKRIALCVCQTCACTREPLTTRVSAGTTAVTTRVPVLTATLASTAVGLSEFLLFLGVGVRMGA
jgi:hypothetical protein